MKIPTSFRFRLIPLTLAATLLLSCGSGSGKAGEANTTKSPTERVTADRALPVGVVIDTVTCVNQSAQSYALYLPKNYSTDKKYPCIIFFDAHARGSLPLRMYKDIAEKYGFILVGSNVSKNGMATDVLNSTITTLWDDIHTRLHLDSACTYTSGFSGGSKVASLAAISHGGIAGVIGCAGGFPNLGQGFKHEFDYFGLVGDYDFNLPEMVQLETYLVQFKNQHQLLTWAGIHSWAPASEFKTAVLWMLASSMKKQTMPKNDAIIAELKADFDCRTKIAAAKKDWQNAFLLPDGAARVLAGLTDVTTYSKQIANLEHNGDFKKASAEFQKLLPAEQAQKQELASAFAAHDEQWWSNKITAMNQQISHAKTLQEANATRRVLAYLGFVSYMAVSQAMAAGDMEHTGRYLHIFKMADPKNPDCAYFNAIFNIKKGDAEAALTALNEAATLGYSDIAQLINEAAFAGLQKDVAFQQVVERVRNNHLGK